MLSLTNRDKNIKIAIVNLIARTPPKLDKIPVIHSNKDAMIVKFAQELKKQCVNSTLMISDAYKPSSTDNLDINIVYLRTYFQDLFRPSRIPFTPGLFNELRNNYDIVVCSEVFQWGTIFAVLAKIFSSKIKIKIIIWQEMAKHQKMLGSLPSLIFHNIILRFFLDKFIVKYVPRGELARIFLINQKIAQKKITAPISHGVDSSVFFYDPNINKERYIFSPSLLIYQKGIDILLKAFATATRELNDVKLIIQGDGPMLTEYKNLAKELNIDNLVIFCTERINHEAMRLRYQKALVTIIASRSDLTIFSPFESLACKTPVIISSGIDIYVDFLDQKGGIVFNNGDFKQLASAMIRIINDEEYREHMGIQALEKAKLYLNHYLYNRFRKIICDVFNMNSRGK